MDERPPINVNKPRYDQSTYLGRLRHFIDVTNPLTLLASSAQLQEAQKLLVDYDQGKRTDLYDKPEEVWRAKKLVDSSIHPDTGKPVVLPFRMAAFVPTNLIILAGMLSPNPSMRSTIFWQVVNQTLNVCVNYSNASAGATMSPQEIGVAYVGATTTSVGLAVGLNSIVPRLRRLSPATRGLLGRFVPFIAVASAGCVNVSLMRWKEISGGTEVYPPATAENPKPEPLGKSPTAGKMAVAQTAASRVLTNIPTMILPPLIMTAMAKRGVFAGPRGPRKEAIANLGLVGAALLVFLPPASESTVALDATWLYDGPVASFPQRASIKASALEPEFQHAVDPVTGKPLDVLEFNKGL